MSNRQYPRIRDYEEGMPQDISRVSIAMLATAACFQDVCMLANLRTLSRCVQPRELHKRASRHTSWKHATRASTQCYISAVTPKPWNPLQRTLHPKRTISNACWLKLHAFKMCACLLTRARWRGAQPNARNRSYIRAPSWVLYHPSRFQRLPAPHKEPIQLGSCWQKDLRSFTVHTPTPPKV